MAARGAIALDPAPDRKLPTTGSPDGASPSGGSAAAVGVERGELAPVVSTDGSGLPYELWRGLDITAIEGQVSKLEIPPGSPVIQSLWRRLLTSEAGSGAASSARFDALRADALYRTGLPAEAADMARRLPDTAEAATALLAARIEIAGSDLPRGCERLKPLLARKAELPKPSQAEVLVLTGYCAVANGNAAGAGLAADLMREDRLDDPAGLAALDAASGTTSKTRARSTRPVALVHYLLHANAGGLDRSVVVERGEPALLSKLATDRGADPELRLLAAEAAARNHGLSPADLAEAYRAAGQAAAGRSSPSVQRAAMFRSAAAERTPLRKVRLIRALLDDARRAGLYWQTLALLGPVEEVLQPVPELGWFAETGIEISLVTGNMARARQWASLGGSLPGDGGLRHWLTLIDLVDGAHGGAQDRSLAAVADLAVRGRMSPDLLHRLATVLDAHDVNVPIPLWEAAGRAPQPTGGHLPPTGVLSELQDASRKKEFGRTLLLVMRTLGPGGAESANIIALGDAIRGLRRAGLEAEARRLGLEALFAGWPRGIQ